MSDIIIPHTLYKYNWRYAQLSVSYNAPGTTGTATGGYIRFYSSKGILKPVPTEISTVSGGDITQLYGLPTTWPFPSRTTTVNNNDDDRAKTLSKIFGYYRLNVAYPYHTYQFRIPVGQPVTYSSGVWAGNIVSYSTEGYIECEFLGEVT